MALPKVHDKTYTCKLPLSGIEVTYTPFKVRDEKILLMALQSNDFDEIVNATKQIVNNCLIETFDIGTMPIIDMEYLFVQLRMKSKGEISKVGIKCRECGFVNPIEVNLEDVKLTNDPPDPTVMITDQIGILFRFPQVNLIHKAKDLDTNVNAMFDIIVESIESVFNGDDVTLARDVSKDELVEFIDSLSENQFSRIKDFFQKVPTLMIETKMKCIKCGEEEDIKLEGLKSFFG